MFGHCVASYLLAKWEGVLGKDDEIIEAFSGKEV
jgi:hypothetical protein